MAAKAATKPEAPKAAPKKKRGTHPAVLWGGLGLVVLFLGLVASLWYLSKGRPGEEGGLLPGITRLLPGERGPEAPGAAPGEEGGAAAPAGPGERAYTVQEGENLWKIANKGVLVDDPWEWRTIMIQNKEKIDYAFVSEETGEWKVMVETGEELTVKARPPAPEAGPVKKKYAVQLMTLPGKQMKKALDMVKTLLADGFYGYLYRIEDKGAVAYRVRVGFYDTDKEAEEIARQILAKYKDKAGYPRQYWVMVPSDRELRGELLDFGAQRAKPWVIELPVRGTQGEALEEMRSAGSLGDIVYISQGRGKNMSRWVYRTRIGFFSSKEQAETVLSQNKDKLPQLARAQVIERTNFKETLPGQNFRLGKPKS
jgi:hypothetical protein